MSRYAPVQDVIADPEAPVYRKSPITRLIRDAALVFSNVVPHVLDIFLPINSKRGINTDASYTGLLFQIVLTLWSVLLYVPLLLLGTVGGVAPLLVGYATAWPFLILQGSPQVKISVKTSTVRENNRRRFSRESWIFINGICTSRSGVELILRKLETLFQRPVTGILNRTLGPIVDLLECLIQRDVGYSTESIREGFMETKKRLQDNNIDKVVLICHSQGGIIAAAIVDQLLDDLSTELISKLEIYTFANAASHFSNPIELGIKTADSGARIKHIEHYANSDDPVSEIGVLAFCTPNRTIRKGSDDKLTNPNPPLISTMNRFNGRLYVRAKMSGHLLLSHYLGVNSILDTPEARRYSRLRQYIGGNSPDE